MRFGLALPHYDTSLEGGPVSWDGVLRVARRAEAAGFDSVWVSDHLFLDWGKYGGSDQAQGALECWTTMAGVAAATERVRIGSLVLCNDFRSPALLAKMAASLDLLAGGRLELGMGAGWYEPEYLAAGIEFSSPKERIARLGEAAHIVARLLEGEELTFKGEHYTIDGAIVRPGPAQSPRPAIWFGGKGDRLLATAARAADGWNFSWLGSVDTYRERSRAADEACTKAGRDPATLRRSVGAYVLVGRDEADVQARYERVLERTPAGVLPQDSAGSALSWEEFQKRGIAGSVDRVTETLGGLSDLGVEEVIVSLGALPFQVAAEDDVEFVATEVVAALR